MKNKQNQITKCLHIYARVSPGKQLKEHYLDLQVEKGIEKAKALGYSYQVYREDGKSANEGYKMSQPVLANILRKVELGEVHHIFVTDSDRLTRNLGVSLDIERLLQLYGVTTHTLVVHGRS